ncbi:hypothetical protein J2751_000680 [Halorubrum alkaliphilum]|uniref:Uncharacterized protein n=1 Tax=Halorubrum alkaliphilum TaxID=261290 RepID=A0A8T4GD36_9EURY|nr:hypothetical protein [Halorubrum alkaliphilum]MBP1921687.1 hypothetical protein [Halorubrum alkaliphilum]
MSSHDAELVIETWQLRERVLPRVPPSGWGTVDRLREAVCLAVACSVDGVEHVEPFTGRATERERFDATVTAESLDAEHVRVVTPTSEPASAEPASGSDATNASEVANGRTDDFAETTEQFDLEEALDRL